MNQTLTTRAVDLRTWEQAERERSAFEASRTSAEDTALRECESNVARYLNPPAETPYPLEYAYHLLGDVRGKQVLDFGCGTGDNTLLLARRGAQVQAVDISPELIEIGRRRLSVNGIDSGVRFITASVYDIPLEDESVDVIFGIAILHHLELPLAAREAKRILRKGGRAIFKEPVRNSATLDFVRGLIPYRAPDVSPFERPLRDAELKEFASGFASYRVRSFYLPYISVAGLLPVVRNYVKPLVRFDQRMLRRFPRLEYYATVKVIELVK